MLEQIVVPGNYNPKSLKKAIGIGETVCAKILECREVGFSIEKFFYQLLKEV